MGGLHSQECWCRAAQTCATRVCQCSRSGHFNFACGYLGDARPVKFSNRVPSIRLSSSQDTPRCTYKLCVLSAARQVSIVNFKCRQEVQADSERLPFFLDCSERSALTSRARCASSHVETNLADDDQLLSHYPRCLQYFARATRQQRQSFRKLVVCAFTEERVLGDVIRWCLAYL